MPDKQIKDFLEDTALAPGDKILFQDGVTSETKWSAPLTVLKAAATKTTDANGWTVYDYGNWKEYRKRTTFNQSFNANTPVLIVLSSNNLPTGMATLSNNFIMFSLGQINNGYNHQANHEVSTTSTTLAISTLPSTTETKSGFVDWVIISP